MTGPKALRHRTKGDDLSELDWLGLPARLRTPDAVLYDEESEKLLYILPGDSGKSQIAVYLDYQTKGAAGPKTINLIVSAYRPTIAEVLRRIANGKLTLLSGSLG